MMNSKIIFWLNDALSFLGVVKSLQEKYGYEVFGILDVTDKQKTFFKTQKIINFSKTWFFHDQILKTRKKPDMNYLQGIEKKYKIDIHLLISNERFFNKWNQYYDFSLDEKLTIVEYECKFFEMVLDEIQPNFLILPMTNRHYDHLFYEICMARKIRVLMIRSSFLITRNIISEEFHLLDKTNNSNKYNFESFESVQNFLTEFDASTRTKRQLNSFQTSKTVYVKAIMKFLFSKNTNPKTHFTYYGRTKSAVLIYTLLDILKKKYREFFINKNLIQKFEKVKPFIYFPLQIEPERSLLITAPNFSNQIKVIQEIVKVLPKGYELYVKEHPASVLRNWHSISFYKEIINLPNTKLVHPNVLSKELIEQSSLIITISSTTGLEAAFYNKPSILFSNLDYEIISSIHKIKSFNELPSVINSCLKKNVKLSDLSNYINLVYANSYSLDYDNIDAEFDHIFHYEGYLSDVEISANQFKLFLEKHSLEFDIVSSECNKKIESYLKND